MSKKHLEEQKLLIENFNNWINEEKCGERDIDETAGDVLDTTPLEEDEQIEEGFLTAGVVATYLASKTFINTVFDILSFYSKLMDANKQIQSDPDAPEELKKDAQTATIELADIGSKLQAIAGKLGWSPKSGLSAGNLSDKQIQQLLTTLYGLVPSKSPEKPDGQPEATDDASVVDADLMARYAKLKNKADK